MAFDTDQGSFNHHDDDQDARGDAGEDVATDNDRAGTTTDRPTVSPPASRCLDSALIHQALQAVRRRRRLASAP